MKKNLFVLPLMLLGGCALFQNDGAYYDEETGLPVDGEFVEERPSTVNYEDPQPEQKVQPTQGMQQRASQQETGQAFISADGTTIELPAQKIYIGDVMASQQTDGYIVVDENAGRQINTLSYSQPIPKGVSTEPRMAQPAVITLQNRDYPNTYVQCMSTDSACISTHEQQGYVRVGGLPQFAGYQEVLGPSDYPQGGRWRNRNNIPRW